MKFLIILSVAIVCASADVSNVVKDESSAPVVKSTYEITPEGAFQYAYETGNKIYAQANGAVDNPNSEYPSLKVNGAFKYTSPDGQPIELSYTADADGFKPVGAHLPVPQEIPEYITRSLAYIAAHPPPAEGVVKPGKPNYG